MEKKLVSGLTNFNAHRLIIIR